MHVSIVKPIGSALSSKTITNLGIKTVIEYRSVGDVVQVFPVDQVPGYITLVDPTFFEEWVKLGKDPAKLIKRYRLALTRLGHRLDEKFDSLVKAVVDRWINAYGPLTPILIDEDVTDIYIDPGGVKVNHRDYGLCVVRLSEVKAIRPVRLFPMRLTEVNLTIRDLVNHIAVNVARRTRTPITAYMPLVSVTDPEYRVRFTVSAEPVSRISIHVRVLPSRPWTLPLLVKQGMLTINQAALLWRLAEDKVPILIIGPMGSGKTSLANAIAMMVKPQAMKVLIMDVDEMNLPGHLVVKLFERKSFGLGVRPITKGELIAHALRMGADYVIVNEVREPEEVKAWLNAVTTGHGGITTFHAEDYQQMVRRLSVLTPNPEDILKDIAVVVMGLDYVPADLGNGVRVLRRFRYVKDIVIPSNINDQPDIRNDLHIRRSIIGELMDAPIDQLLASISKLHTHA